MSQKTLMSRYTHRLPGHVTTEYDRGSNPIFMATQYDQGFSNPGIYSEFTKVYRFKDGFRDSLPSIASDFYANLKWLYSFLFVNDSTGGADKSVADLTKLTATATYMQWKRALDQCKSQSEVDSLKQALSAVWAMASMDPYRNPAFSDTEYLSLMNYQPNLWWNSYKWLIIGGGIGAGLLITLVTTAKILK